MKKQFFIRGEREFDYKKMVREKKKIGNDVKLKRNKFYLKKP